MIRRGTTELAFKFDHPEVDIQEEAIVEVRWVYVPEIPANLENDYGEPYDFTYDVEVIKLPYWVTLEEIEELISEMSIYDIMNS